MAGAGTSANDCHLDEVAISIRRRFKGLSDPSDCCIFTVPKRFRRSNEEAYTPCAVAIGPYHRHEPSLKPMEDHKLLYLQKLLEPDDRLEEYIKRVKSWENEARSSYSEQINLDPDEFTKMMLLDGIFVIQIFLMLEHVERRLLNDRIFDRPWMLTEVCRDMTLLENQIPFFVIERLFEMAFGTQDWCTPQNLRQLMYNFFSVIMGVEKPPEVAMQFEPKHIVDALRLLLLTSSMACHWGNQNFICIPSATELAAVGVKLTRGESKCLFDIKFENGELKIPCLDLYDKTESFFRNIIAFEQCYSQCEGEGNLISYMLLMDQLVDTPADMELLIDKGIIKNWLSNKEDAMDLLNALCKETNTVDAEYYFNRLSHELIKHCQRPHNMWKGMLNRNPWVITLKRDYCSNPWVISSVIAAVVLLLLTVVQTVCSVLSIA